MAATVTLNQRNGSAGADTPIATFSYCAIDAPNVLPSDAPLINGQNSNDVYLSLAFSGVFNMVRDVSAQHTTGALPDGTALIGESTTTYAAPSQVSMATGTDITSPNSSIIELGVGAEPAVATESSITEAGTSSFFHSQLQLSEDVGANAAGGAIVFTWMEN